MTLSDIGSARFRRTRGTRGPHGVGVLGAMAIGIGGMVGGGIFAVLGTAVEIARGATPLAFALAGVIALLTAHSYARLSASCPSAGGTVSFLDRAFGVDVWRRSSPSRSSSPWPGSGPSRPRASRRTAGPVFRRSWPAAW